MGLNKLAFHLKLYYCNCLVHLAVNICIGKVILALSVMQLKAVAGVILVGIKSKLEKWKKIDTITVFQNIKVSISCRETQNCGDAGKLASSCSHPYYIVIAPLNINAMVMHKSIHAQMRPRASVIDISYNVKVIHNKAGNGIG